MPVINDEFVPRSQLTAAERPVRWKAINAHIIERRNAVELATRPLAMRLGYLIGEGLDYQAAKRQLHDRLIDLLRDTFEFGAREARSEIAALRETNGFIPGAAESITAARRDYSRAWRPEQAEAFFEDEVEDAVDEVVRAALAYDNPVDSSAAAAKELRNAVLTNVGTALNLGRVNGAMTPAGQPPQYAMRSEQLDKNTCPNCETYHGTIVIVNSTEFYQILPPAYCFGMGRCRGVMVFADGVRDLRSGGETLREPDELPQSLQPPARPAPKSTDVWVPGMTPTQLQAVQRWARSGKPADDFWLEGLTPTQLLEARKALREVGRKLDIPEPYSMQNLPRDARVFTLFKQGRSAKEVAEATGLSQLRVRNIFKAQQVPGEYRNALLWQLRMEGRSVKEIAQSIGLSEVRVRRLLPKDMATGPLLGKPAKLPKLPKPQAIPKVKAPLKPRAPYKGAERVESTTVGGYTHRGGWQANVRGVKVFVEDGFDEGLNVFKNYDDYLKALPAKERGKLRRINHMRGRSPDDPSFAQKYGQPGFKASATGGNGRISFWREGNSSDLMPEQTFWHEVGHLAHPTRGPLDESAWASAVEYDLKLGAQREAYELDVYGPGRYVGSTTQQRITLNGKSVTSYGELNDKEDWAEFYSLCLLERRYGRLFRNKLTGQPVSISQLYPARYKKFSQWSGVKLPKYGGKPLKAPREAKAPPAARNQIRDEAARDKFMTHDWRGGGYSANEAEQLRSYQGSGYRSIAEWLRDGTASYLDEATVRGVVDSLDRSMSRYQLDQPALLYRGMRSLEKKLAQKGYSLDRPEELIGKWVDDKSFASTSTSYETARFFANGGSNVVLHISVPKGMRGVWIGRNGVTSQHRVNIYIGEDEFLLDRDVRYRITKVSKRPGFDVPYDVYVTAEYLPGAASRRR